MYRKIATTPKAKRKQTRGGIGAHTSSRKTKHPQISISKVPERRSARKTGGRCSSGAKAQAGVTTQRLTLEAPSVAYLVAVSANLLVSELTVPDTRLKLLTKSYPLAPEQQQQG